MSWKRKRAQWSFIERKTPNKGKPFIYLFIYLFIRLWLRKNGEHAYYCLWKSDVNFSTFYTVHYDKQMLVLLGPYIWSKINYAAG